MTKVEQKGQLKRRILWITGLVVLVLAGTGYWFYNFYFASTEAAIRHAEAFLFRRMTVAQLAEQGIYRFFYVTNRKPRCRERACCGPLRDRARRRT